jgi:thiosulfate reductase cytochrome b subunit
MNKSAASPDDAPSTEAHGHRLWVRVSHWIVVASFLVLCVTGVFILAVHPRLYWGEVGNDLTPAILEFPLSDNYRPEEYERTVTFGTDADAPFTANRNYEIFNQNHWGRSLHFLAAWFLVITGVFYLIKGAMSGHIRRYLLPALRDLAPANFWRDLKDHLQRRLKGGGGPPYGLLQRCAYASVIFIAFPLMFVTGHVMAPAITAAFPFLLDWFGYQTARTLHFFGFAALVGFFLVHVVMVIVSGFRRHIRAMTLGD